MTNLQKQYDGDIDIAFEIAREDEPDSPLGNDFVEMEVKKDENGLFAIFITKPARS